MFVWQRFPDDGARGKAKATRAQPRRSGRSTLEAFGPTVRNRRNAALSLALLVAHWADASLILPLAELGSAPTLLCSRKAESSIVGNTLSAESDARPQAKGRKGGERYRKKGLHGCTKQQLQEKQFCIKGAAQRAKERGIRQSRHHTGAQQAQRPLQTLRGDLCAGLRQAP